MDFNTSIYDLDLPLRGIRCLMRAGFRTLQNILDLGSDETKWPVLYLDEDDISSIKAVQAKYGNTQ